MNLKAIIHLNSILLLGLILFAASGCKKDDKSGNTVTDIDGNTYRTVTLGTQVWMAENLKVTRYNDGSAIPLKTDWLLLDTPGYCWYNNFESYKDNYGALYNWYAVSTGKLAPVGWHVPTDDEWEILYNYLASSGSRFTPAMAGYRSSLGTFYGMNEYGCWWSSTIITAFGNTNSCSRYAEGAAGTYEYDECSRKEGQSVRCIKD